MSPIGSKVVTSLRSTLRSVRRAIGLTQAQIATRAQISRNHYVQIERGNKRPSLTVALALARIVGVPVEALFDGDPTSTPALQASP